LTDLFWLSDIILAAAVALSFACPAYFALRAGQLKNSMLLSNEFFNYADKLVEDEGTPDLVVSYLETMAKIINQPKFSGSILRFALTGKLRDATNKPTARSEELISVIHGMRKELQETIARASVACLLSVTYKSPVFGVIVRRMTLFSIESDQEQAEIVASNIFANGLAEGRAHA
jgi:hypothetical protein